jgi:curved DNA-binding protein CbpA
MTAEPTGQADHYKILQVDPEADPEVIQAAYHRLARKFHPDVGGSADAERMARLNLAWEVLRDPDRRAAYDRARARAAVPGAQRPTSGPAGTGAAPAGTPGPGPGRGPDHPPGSAQDRPAETVSPHWTSGRSAAGGGYDPSTMRSADGHAAAGPPPGKPSGTVLGFGRYAGWSLGEIARVDLEYIEWLDRAPIGRAYRDEIDALLRKAGRRRAARPGESERRGLFRR